MLIPQAIAYAYLAGLPPIYGLYSALIPLLIYMLLGTSMHLSIGPVAVTSILISTSIAKIAEPFSLEFINLVLIAGLCIGIIQLIAGLLKVGFLVNTISQPVISGLISAAAIIIIISQLKSAFGISMPNQTSVFASGIYFTKHILETKPLTVLISMLSIGILIFFKIIKSKFPVAILLIIAFTALSFFLEFNKLGVQIVGEIPKGLPSLYIPRLNWQTIKELLPAIFTVATIGYVGSIGIAKSFQMKYRNYEVNPNKEFIALGIAKIAGTFFQGNLASGSYSRSAINDEAGAKTTISAVFTVIIIGLTLLFFTPFLYFLPKAVLAAIILVSVISLIKIKEAITYLKVKWDDFLIMMVTFIVSLIVNIETGILSGVLLSFVLLQYRSATPHIAELGRIKNTNYFRNVTRFKQGIQHEDYVIIRFDDQLYFGNAEYFKDSIHKIIEKRKKKPKFIILHANNIHSLDSTGLYYLESLNNELNAVNIELLFSATIGPVRDILASSGSTYAMSTAKQFMNIADAISYIENNEVFTNEKKLTLQYNKRLFFRIFKKKPR